MSEVIARPRTNVVITLLAAVLLCLFIPLSIAVGWLMDVLEIEGEPSGDG